MTLGLPYSRIIGSPEDDSATTPGTSNLLEVPVSDLLVPGLRRTEKRFFRGAEHDVYFYDVGRHTIWGATARILSNLLGVIARLPAWGAVRPA